MGGIHAQWGQNLIKGTKLYDKKPCKNLTLGPSMIANDRVFEAYWVRKNRIRGPSLPNPTRLCFSDTGKSSSTIIE